MDDPLISLLAAHPAYAGLPLEILSEIRDAGYAREYKAGTFIIRQGELATFQFHMCSGSAKITHITPDGNQVLQRFMGAGDAYGIAAIFGDMEFASSIEAIEDCEVLVWPAKSITLLLERYPRLILNMFRIVMRRQRELQERYLELLVLSVEQRLAHALLRMCKTLGRTTPQGCVIDVQLSRSDLADHVGATVYTVSRVLQRWERKGLISSSRERVTVLDENALQDIAEDP